MDAKRPQWTVVARCPACGEAARHSCGALQERYYRFGTQKVSTPAIGIRVYECARCALAYKSPVPDPVFLAGVFEHLPGSKRIAPWNYADDVAVLRSLCGGPNFDLLDVGAAAGDVLSAFATAGVSGRRSVLYAVHSAGLECSLDGEFIEGFLDSPRLSWSGKPYDVVTAFDVIAQLNNPFVAFSNLRSLLKPEGLLLIESGNAESAWPLRFGLHGWWYARLIEHHVFWSHRSLQYSAAGQDMQILQWEDVRHKSRRQLRPADIARDMVKMGLYRLAPDGYATLASAFGKQGNQPCSPFAKDQFRAILRRV